MYKFYFIILSLCYEKFFFVKEKFYQLLTLEILTFYFFAAIIILEIAKEESD